MAELEKFICSLANVDGDEIGSGVIVQIDLEDLLQGPSSLEKKVHGKLSTQEKCYALITAHSNVHEDCGSAASEPSVVECLRDRRRVVLANSDHLKTIDEIRHVSCRAVSCCGIDSMLRMPQPSRDPKHGLQVRPLHHTLQSHDRRVKCNIGYDFVVVFLESEVVRQWFPEDSSQPPMLSLTLCSRLPIILRDKLEVHVYWRSDNGSVKREKVGIRPGHLKSQPQVQGFLGDEISRFEAYQSLKYIPQEREGASGIQSHVGAPVCYTPGTGPNHLIGINTGKGVTSFYGILNLLKGGVVPFLAAMRRPNSNARALMPSRWKDYILDHVDPHMQSLGKTYRGQYVADLLHHLLEKRAGTTIVKLAPSNDMEDVVAGLNVLTALFNKLKNVEGVHQCCNGIKCLGEFCSTDLHNCLQHFANNPESPHFENMVIAMFECFEALLNYKGIDREVLSRSNNIMKCLIDIATSRRYESNAVVNRCFKTIIIASHAYLVEELEQYRGH